MARRAFVSVGAISSAASISSDHPVIALVAVQRLDDPIAPAPHEPVAVADVIAFAPAIPVAVTPDIHPVPAPTLAVALIREQPVDCGLVGLGRAVRQESVDFLQRGRHADQIQIDPAQKRSRVGFGQRCQLSLLEFRRDKGVDRISYPVRVL